MNELMKVSQRQEHTHTHSHPLWLNPEIGIMQKKGRKGSKNEWNKHQSFYFIFSVLSRFKANAPV